MNGNILQLAEAYETVNQYSMSDSGHEHSTLNAKIFPGSTGPNEMTSTPVASQTAKAKFLISCYSPLEGRSLWGLPLITVWLIPLIKLEVKT